MEEIQLSPEARGLFKKIQGITDEELKDENLTPTQRRLFNAATKFEDYNMVAEVVWSYYCAHQPKPGDKYVFRSSGRFVPEESTHPGVCLWAIARFLPFIHVVYDRLAEGLEDLSPVGWDHVKCADTGLKNGGCGEVLFRIYCEKVPSSR